MHNKHIAVLATVFVSVTLSAGALAEKPSDQNLVTEQSKATVKETAPVKNVSRPLFGKKQMSMHEVSKLVKQSEADKGTKAPAK